MANPQIENGYTKISNEILENLIRSGINGSEFAIALFIIRKTYGYNKKQDAISISQFAQNLPYSSRAIMKSIKALKVVNIISLVNKGSPHGNSSIYAFNKDFDTWKRVVNKSSLVNKKVKGSEQSFQKVVNKSSYTKERITKETITKEKGENKSELELEKVIEAWNSVSTFKKTRKINDDLLKQYKKIRKGYSSYDSFAEDLNLAAENYYKEIKSRSPSSDYASHRFSLYLFLKQANGFAKFLNE